MGLRRAWRKLRTFMAARDKIRSDSKISQAVNKILLDKELDEPIKLHIGCGTNYLPGWINIDNNSDNNITQLDINFDLRNPLPFRDSCVDFIYNEHFLEHLKPEEGQRTIREFLRVLEPGGVVRIAMPDLAYTVAFYGDIQWHEHPDLKKYGLDFVKTRGEMINISFRWWGHKWLYDWEELERRLSDAGAQIIEQCTHCESRHQELCNLETRSASTLIAEVTKTQFFGSI